MGSLVRLLVDSTAQCVNAGAFPVFTVNDLAHLASVRPSKSFSQKISRISTTTGQIKRVGHGLYTNPLFPPSGPHVLERIARLVQPFSFFYSSLETELSRSGDISQVPMGYLTLMTTGRSGLHRTDFGTIEFTHTKKDPNLILDELYFDSDCGIFRARPSLAFKDLKRVGRNLQMVESV